MNVNCKVLVLLLVVSSGVWGSPQWNRQSTLSSPLSMGMRFLGNLRNGMTRTFRGLFGGGTQQAKEVPQGRPIRQQLTPPPPAALSPVHNIGTQPPSSFFTVLHESEVSTAFPDTQGFTDESFRPSEFFTGHIPFQGNVEEETLPFHQEVVIGSVHDGNNGQHNSFAVLGNGNNEEHNSFAVIGNENNGQHNSFAVVGNAHDGNNVQHNSFGVFENKQTSSRPQGGSFSAQLPPSTSFGSSGGVHKDTTIPFGNTNTFNLGHTFKQVPTQLPLGPTHFFQEDIQSRKSQDVALETVQSVAHHRPQTVFTSRSDSKKPKPQIVHPKTTVTQGLHTTQSKSSPLTGYTSSLTTKSQPIPTTLESHNQFSTYETVTDTTEVPTSPEDYFIVTERTSPVTEQRSPVLTEVKQQRDTSKKPQVHRKPSGHINTGTKMRVSPISDDGEGVEVSSYEFGYGVLDNDTGNQFFHAEKREEGLTKGSYKIQLPDGRVQTVTYLADHLGFHPKITYEGKAKYPEVKEEKNV